MAAEPREPGLRESRLKLTEVFLSIQGEADSVGWPTVFVRLTGCPLRCTWCDTAYAFHGGEWWTLAALFDHVGSFGVPRVCVTGGEPLAQRNVLPLMSALCDAGLAVSLETSGALDIGGVDPRVSRVVDVKAPGSGEAERNRLENLSLLTARDQLKFVIASRDDFEWAHRFVAAHDLAGRCPILFSPAYGRQDPAQLAEWILADRLPVRLQIQLHKVLWGEMHGR